MHRFDAVGDGATYSVSELATEIRDFLAHAYPAVWVTGEVQRAKTSQRGHLYFELVEKGEGDRIVGKLDAVVWRGEYARIRRELAKSRQEIVEGLEIRCRVGVDLYPPAGRLQLVVREVDPNFSLGLLERRRIETWQALEAAGLVERNRSLALSPLPLRLGLVTSAGSAAYHDFLSGLQASGYGFEVVFAHASVQGSRAEREVVAALEKLAEVSAGPRGPLDALVVIRGGGSRSDLAAFDSRAIAEAVARSPLPVITGLGHQIDETLAEQVAHTPAKTPTQAAEFLVACVAESEAEVEELRERIAARSRERLLLAAESLGRVERVAEAGQRRLRSARQRVDDLALGLERLARGRLREAERRALELARRLTESAPRSIERSQRAGELAARRLVELARGRLREARAVVQGAERLCQGLAPRRLLERGFSITRTRGGDLVRDPAQAPAGSQITTLVAGGTLASRVEET